MLKYVLHIGQRVKKKKENHLKKAIEYTLLKICCYFLLYITYRHCLLSITVVYQYSYLNSVIYIKFNCFEVKSLVTAM